MIELTLAQLACLRDAIDSADGSIRARGHGCSVHALVTARALQRRGLLDFVRYAMRGGEIFRVNAAGREAYFAALDPEVKCGHLPCMVHEGHPAKRLTPHN